jgi:hypothetical protein
VTWFLGWVSPFKIPRKPWISLRVHYFLGGSIPSKSQENCREVQDLKNFGQACPSRSRETTEKSAFWEIFWVPKKLREMAEKSKFQNLFITGKPQRFFGQAHPSKSRDTTKKSAFWEFLSTLKIAGNHGKIQISKPVYLGKTVKIQISKPVTRSLPKKIQLANPHIFLLFLPTSASK